MLAGVWEAPQQLSRLRYRPERHAVMANYLWLISVCSLSLLLPATRSERVENNGRARNSQFQTTDLVQIFRFIKMFTACRSPDFAARGVF